MKRAFDVARELEILPTERRRRVRPPLLEDLRSSQLQRHAILKAMRLIPR